MSERKTATGPLRGVRIVEFLGIGPGPYASMMLSDMGADVVTIARAGQWKRDKRQFINRGRRVVELDLKKPADVAQALQLIESADALIEGFRPQVMERLGLGPDVTLARNPRLAYCRMTGWGQDGPLALAAGHDPNYIAITGALDSFRASNGEPVSPLNLIGDYGGGALFLVVGMLAAIINARASGKGQVVDVAMCDGVTNMLTTFHAQLAIGRWTETPRTNMLDGGAHFYRPYKCKDGRYISIGAIEPQFYAQLRQIAGMDDPAFDAQLERDKWPDLQKKMEAIFLTKTRDEWAKLLEGTDACAAAIVSLKEAQSHPHLLARKTFVEAEGGLQPAPAPRFLATPSTIQHSADVAPMPVADLLASWADGAAVRSRAS